MALFANLDISISKCLEYRHFSSLLIAISAEGARETGEAMQWEEKGGVQCQAVLPAVCACRAMSESAAAAAAILYGAHSGGLSVLYRVRPGSVTCLSRVCHGPINPLRRMYSLYAAYKSPHLRIGLYTVC